MDIQAVHITATPNRRASRLIRILSLTTAIGLAVGVVPIASGQEVSVSELAEPAVRARVPEVQTIFPQRRHRRLIVPTWQPVEVRSVDADVVIDGDVATTTLAITLYNPSSSTARCEMAIPIPGEAAVRSFRLDGLEGDPPARLLPRAEARAAFEAIVRKMIDPGLLEFAGYGMIKSSVFPVPAQGEQTFRVTYEHVVGGSGTQVEYVLPRSSSPGASPDWDVEITIKGETPVLSAFSTSHGAAVKINDDGTATVASSKLNKPGPFRLIAMRQAGDGPAMSLLTYPDPESVDAGFFMLVMAAPSQSSDADKIARDVTVVIDRSGSMQGEKFAQAKEAAMQVINALGDNETFRIVDYSSTVSEFTVGAGTPNPRAEANSYLESLNAVGGTNINEALLTAIRGPAAPDALPIMLFLTDGLATVGIESEYQIRENAVKANEKSGRRIFTFGVGHDVNVPLLSDLARATRGVPEFVGPDEDVEAAVGRVFARLSGPVLTDLQLKGEHAQNLSDIFPRQLGDLYQQQRLVVLGRYRANERGFPIIVAGGGSDGETERRIELDPSDASPANSHIARLWAQQKITWLIDELRSAGADPSVQNLSNMQDDPRLAELIDEIVSLSTTYGILTEYTSFIAAEESMLAGASANRAELEMLMSGVNDQRSGEQAVNLGKVQSARGQPLRTVVSGGQSPFGAEQADVALDGMVSNSIVSNSAVPFQYAQRSKAIKQANLTIQTLGPDTLYNQRGRWVDANLVNADQQLADPAKDRPEPDETVAFGSDRYFNIGAQLAASNRQALLAVAGEVEILLDGKRILIQNPA